MSRYNSELSQREQEMLKIRRDSDTKAAELVKMEKMLEHTKGLMDKKKEPAADSKGYQDNMGMRLARFALFSALSCVCRCCVSDRVALWQWRTWRRRCAPADATGETPSTTRRCWRAR